MQRLNMRVSQEGEVVFDGTFFYVENITCLHKIHKDNGWVATIDINGRSEYPTFIDQVSLNNENNIIGIHAGSSTVFCLRNSDSLSGTFVPSDDDFVWMAEWPYVDILAWINGSLIWAGDYGDGVLIDSITGDGTPVSEEKNQEHYVSYCNFDNIFGTDSSSATYVANLLKTDRETRQLIWEVSCSGCTGTTVGYDGYVYTVSMDNELLYKIDPDNGDKLKSIDLSAHFSFEWNSEIHQMFVDTDGNIFVTFDGKLKKLDNSGNLQFEKQASGLTLQGAI